METFLVALRHIETRFVQLTRNERDVWNIGTNVMCQSERCQLTDDKVVKNGGFKGGDCVQSCLLGSDGV